jgi:hypothetical protein
MLEETEIRLTPGINYQTFNLIDGALFERRQTNNGCVAAAREETTLPTSISISGYKYIYQVIEPSSHSLDAPAVLQKSKTTQVCVAAAMQKFLTQQRCVQPQSSIFLHQTKASQPRDMNSALLRKLCSCVPCVVAAPLQNLHIPIL